MEKLINNLLDHEQLRTNALNMVASENRTSPLVRIMMASDLAHRYSDQLYGGTNFIRRIMEICVEVLQELFKAKYVLITPLSGNLAVLSAVLGLTKIEERIAKIFHEDGGYPLNLRAFNRIGVKLPFDHEKRTINFDLSENVLLQTPPAIIMLGQSVFTHPHPVQAFRTFLNTHSLDIPIIFDGSHVLGLIAGHQFQDPLREGADALLGSTHKTFFGPQGGIVVSNNQKIFNKIKRFGGFTQGSHILIDNLHPHRVAALAMAGLELLEFGKEYATQVVKNSQALAQEFHRNGLPVKGTKVNFTQSHQVLLDYPQKTAFKIKNKLESIGIFTDALLRFGTSELTRLGMKEAEMKEIAHIISDCIQENLHHQKLIKQIKDLSQTFQKVQYTFDMTEYPSIKNLVKNYLHI